MGGVLLAAGNSTRMGSPKATLRWEGEPFVVHIARLFGRAHLAPIVVVGGIHTRQIEDALAAENGVEVLHNPTPDRGQLSSLKIALAVLAQTVPKVNGALVSLVDHPAVRPETIGRLRDCAAPERIVVPTFEGKSGHPVVFGRDLFEELSRTPDEQGARTVVRADPDRVTRVATRDRGILIDIDTPTELAAAKIQAPRLPDAG